MSKTRAADDVDAIYARLQELRRERVAADEEKAKAAQQEAASRFLTEAEVRETEGLNPAALFAPMEVAEIHALGESGWYFEFRDGYVGPFRNADTAELVGGLVAKGCISVEAVRAVLEAWPP